MKFWDALFYAGVIGIMMLWATSLIISIIREIFKQLNILLAELSGEK